MIGKQILHYKILAKLGEGGMGVVYKAEDTKLKREVALKFLPTNALQGKEEKERFMREAQAAAALNHANIAHIYAIEEVDGEMFIVMEFIEGRELREIIAENPPEAQSLRGVLDIASQIAEGLKAAHAKGVTHRDIKSGNIMVTESGQVKIMDFGLAKIAGGAQLTKVHSTLGTAAYMSPEQTRGEVVDHRTDIWAFGVVLHEMLTSKMPFKGDYEQAVIYSILNEEPEYPAEIPPELRTVLQKALQKDVSTRYRDSGELVEDLKGISGGNQPESISSKKKQQPKNLKYLFVGFAILAIVVVAIIFLRPSLPENQTIDSIAVLPLKNLSGDSNQDYFADGMTEALITDLSKIRTIKVISRTSVMQFKNTENSLPEIAAALGVKAIVEGSVIREGNQVRISAQLIEAATDKHLWAESYDRDMTNILSLQREIALAVVSQIKAVLSPEEKSRLTAADTVDPKAHENYLKGLHHLHPDTEEDLLKSIEYFNRAVAISPTYSVAYVGLADAYQRITSTGIMVTAEGYPKAIAAVNRALELEPDLNEAHLALARIKFTLEWDWEGAEREFLRVLEQNPNSAKGHERYAIFLAMMRRFEEANLEILKARELDPLSAWINDNVGWIYYFQRRYDEALVEYKKTIDMYPNFTMAYHEQSLVYMFLGMPDLAIESAQKAVRISPDDPTTVTTLGLVYAMAGEREKAEQIIEQILERSKTKAIKLYDLTLIFSALGDNDKAFEYLEQSYEKKSSWPFIIRIDPAADKLRSDPRYAPFVRKMGLEP